MLKNSFVLCLMDVMSCHVTAQATPSMNMGCLSEQHLQWITVTVIIDPGPFVRPVNESIVC